MLDCRLPRLGSPAGMGDDMKFVAAAIVVAITTSLAPVTVQASSDKVAAKAKRSYEQCYADCTRTGGKTRSCAAKCQTNS